MQLLQSLSDDLFVYQPGNGTRYMILAKKIAPSVSDAADLAFFWLLRGDRGGNGMILESKAPLHLAYFIEKTQISNECDAVALLCFLAEHFGVSIEGIPAHYRKEHWFQQAEWRVT